MKLFKLILTAVVLHEATANSHTKDLKKKLKLEKYAHLADRSLNFRSSDKNKWSVVK